MFYVWSFRKHCKSTLHLSLCMLPFWKTSRSNHNIHLRHLGTGSSGLQSQLRDGWWEQSVVKNWISSKATQQNISLVTTPPPVFLWVNVLQMFSFPLGPAPRSCLLLSFEHIPGNRAGSQVTLRQHLAYLRLMLRLNFLFPRSHKLFFMWNDLSACSLAFLSAPETWFVPAEWEGIFLSKFLVLELLDELEQ